MSGINPPFGYSDISESQKLVDDLTEAYTGWERRSIHMFPALKTVIQRAVIRGDGKIANSVNLYRYDEVVFWACFALEFPGNRKLFLLFDLPCGETVPGKVFIFQKGGVTPEQFETFALALGEEFKR